MTFAQKYYFAATLIGTIGFGIGMIGVLMGLIGPPR